MNPEEIDQAVFDAEVAALHEDPDDETHPVTAPV